MSEAPTWRDRFPEEVTCIRCLEVKPAYDLDRLLWCDECKALGQARAGRMSWGVGVAIALAAAAWVWITVRPSADLIPGAWLGTFLATVWVASRVSKEVIYGAMRFRNGRAVEATPPSFPDPSGTSREPQD